MSEAPQPDRSGSISADEHTIYWELFGTGNREVVCLLNGLAMHTGAWYGFLPRFRPEFDVLLWDYPGQGRSSTADVPYHLDRMAGYLARILDEAGIPRIHLMGISYGGFVALEFARQLHSRLHTLILSGIILSHETLFEMYEDLSLRFYRGGPEAFDLYTRYMYEKIFGEAFVTAAGAARLETMRQSFYERYHRRTAGLIRLTEAQDPFFAALDERVPEYRAIPTPTLIIAGDEDRVMAPKFQKKIASILPNSRFEMIDNSGHVVYLEQPDRFFDLVLGMMRARRT
jgi:pimeloyl-ACP methyl ester carboxylesterase